LLTEKDLSLWNPLLLAAIPVVVLLVLCYFWPAVGRFLGKLTAVLGMGIGVGLLVWGILGVAQSDPPPVTWPFAGASYSLVIGSGAGVLTSGIVALILSFLVRLPAGPGRKSASEVSPPATDAPRRSPLVISAEGKPGRGAE
jgi:hypothetical protein